MGLAVEELTNNCLQPGTRAAGTGGRAIAFDIVLGILDGLAIGVCTGIALEQVKVVLIVDDSVIVVSEDGEEAAADSGKLLASSLVKERLVAIDGVFNVKDDVLRFIPSVMSEAVEAGAVGKVGAKVVLSGHAGGFRNPGESVLQGGTMIVGAEIGPI